jgi:hypothetical protein
MKVLLTINYQDILLPDETGLQSLLKILSRGVNVDDRRHDSKRPRISLKDPIKITAEMINQDTLIAKRPLGLPSPDPSDPTEPAASSAQ